MHPAWFGLMKLALILFGAAFFLGMGLAVFFILRRRQGPPRGFDVLQEEEPPLK